MDKFSNRIIIPLVNISVYEILICPKKSSICVKLIKPFVCFWFFLLLYLFYIYGFQPFNIFLGIYLLQYKMVLMFANNFLQHVQLENLVRIAQRFVCLITTGDNARIYAIVEKIRNVTQFMVASAMQDLQECTVQMVRKQFEIIALINLSHCTNLNF